jgi:raffinose/stachyose/melibiose transport system permease protein
MVSTPTVETSTAETPRRSGRERKSVGTVVVVGVLVAGAALMLAPFLLVAINAFKTPIEYANDGPLSIPNSIYLDGIIDFWNRVEFGRKLINSAIISLTVSVGAVALSLLNAFALGVGRVRGRTWLLVLFLAANMIPHEALVYPLFYLSRTLGIYDTLFSVIVIFIVIQSAFGTYLLSSVFSNFPSAVLEAAEVDGASKWQLLWRVVAPVSMPTLTVLFVFFFIWTWNEFFLPLIFLISNENQTVPVALGVLQGQRLMDATTSSASGLLGILPAVLFFLVFQRTLTRGIALGAVK